jgi:carbamoyl-phosphate synthase small subunit
MVVHAIRNARDLIGKLPLFGICLGHQILCLAMGARIYKLRFGHHGGNHPVKDVRTGEVKITSQNHNYAADEDSIRRQGAEVTHMNLYDGTVEGMVHPELSVFGIQYHPEACPGPNDSHYLFGGFVASMRENAKA